MMANKNKEVGDFFGQLMNIKVDAFDETKKLKGIVRNASAGKKKTALGAVGDLTGSRLTTPVIPFRIVKDAQNIYRGLNSLPEIKYDYKTYGFWNGFFRDGLIDYIGLRPKGSKHKE